MPGAKDTDHKIVEAVQNGELAEDVLDRVCERVLTMVYHLHEQKRGGTINQEADHRLARQIAAESMVVLKMRDDCFPFPERKDSIYRCICQRSALSGQWLQLCEQLSGDQCL